MASISSAGIGSGLDVNSIVTQLMKVEKAPLTQMQADATRIQNKLSAFGKIQSYVSTLRDAADKLAGTATWGSTSVASSDSSIATATSNGSAVAGNYSLSVEQLATAQTVASPATAFPVGAGRLRIQLGSVPQTVDVSIAAGDTAAQVRDKINAAKGGVVASIVTDSSGSRLVLRSSETGADQAFTVTEVVTDGNGAETTTTTGALAQLTYDPAQPAPVGQGMALTQSAGNARATLNGLSIESGSNVLSNVVDGVSLKLSRVSANPVDIQVSTDDSSIKAAVTAFVEAYNALNSYLGTQTAYDATNKKAGLLQGDSGVNSVRSAMRNIVSGTGTMAGSYQRLAQIGLDIKKDGSLSVDDTKLSAAVSGNLDAVKSLFANKDLAVAGNNGFALQVKQWGDAMLKFDGSINSRVDSLQRQSSANGKKQDDFNLRMNQVETRLRAQYTSLDTQMGKLSGLSSYLTQQVTAWNNNSSG